MKLIQSEKSGSWEDVNMKSLRWQQRQPRQTMDKFLSGKPAWALGSGELKSGGSRNCGQSINNLINIIIGKKF